MASDLDNLSEWVVYLEDQRKILMAKIDELTSIVTALGDAVAGAVVQITELQSALSQRQQEDAVIAQAVDKLKAIGSQLSGIGGRVEQQPEV